MWTNKSISPLFYKSFSHLKPLLNLYSQLTYHYPLVRADTLEGPGNLLKSLMDNASSTMRNERQKSYMKKSPMSGAQMTDEEDDTFEQKNRYLNVYAYNQNVYETGIKQYKNNCAGLQIDGMKALKQTIQLRLDRMAKKVTDEFDTDNNPAKSAYDLTEDINEFSDDDIIKDVELEPDQIGDLMEGGELIGDKGSIVNLEKVDMSDKETSESADIETAGSVNIDEVDIANVDIDDINVVKTESEDLEPTNISDHKMNVDVEPLEGEQDDAEINDEEIETENFVNFTEAQKIETSTPEIDNTEIDTLAGSNVKFGSIKEDTIGHTEEETEKGDDQEHDDFKGNI